MAKLHDLETSTYRDRLYSKRVRRRKTVATTIHIDEDVREAARLRLNMSRVCEDALRLALRERGVDIKPYDEPGLRQTQLEAAERVAAQFGQARPPLSREGLEDGN